MRIHHLTALSSRLLRSAAAGFAAGQTRRALGALPDHMLKDIGISRGEIDRFGR